MKITIITVLVLFGISTVRASDFDYICYQVRTAAEKAAATSPLKKVNLAVNCRSFELETTDFQIEDIDERLLEGGAPLTHVTYGGYFTNTLGEVFSCQREI